MMLQNEQIPIGVLHRVYNAACTCAVPLAVAGLVCSSRGRRRLSERLGGLGKPVQADWWFHAASVGEVQGLIPFFSLIRAKHPNHSFFLTATSPTGLERGRRFVETERLAPLDAPCLVARAFHYTSVKRFVLSETELWPNLLRYALKTGIPCHIANGRISDYTRAWYQRLRPIFVPLLNRFTSISVPDTEQLERFQSLGVSRERLHVTGHSKYDYQPRYKRELSYSQLRTEFFADLTPDEKIVTLGSIREGEEFIWLDALQKAWGAGHKLRVIVAPRHAEKFEYFWHSLTQLGVPVARWSSHSLASMAAVKVLLLDTMGDLERAYAASDLAFVGATLVDIGGHNPFEPAMYGVPIVVGPFTSVIKEPIALLRSAGSVFQVNDSGSLQSLLRRLDEQSDKLQIHGAAGQKVWEKLQGASQRLLEVIQSSEAP